MTIELLRDIVALLPRGRTVFYYFKERYVLLLLELLTRESRRICDLRKSAFGKLLEKPMAKEVLGRIGRSTMYSWDFEYAWPREVVPYRLTVGQWPDTAEQWSRNCHQTTRRGYNLVLQLNFNVGHNRQLRRLLGQSLSDFVGSYHPVAQGGELTLAWARIDLSMDTREALIEEIQSDWVRNAMSNANYGKTDESYRPWRTYVRGPFRWHRRVWAEAMLAATLWFLVRELGMEQVFYHTHASGSLLKHIRWSQPPKSLYSDLPKRFCFVPTHNGPRFIRDTADRRTRRYFASPETQWYYLDLGLECAVKHRFGVSQ